jgi:hypothetical protein
MWAEQHGFRGNTSVVDLVLLVRQIIGKRLGFVKDTCLGFN